MESSRKNLTETSRAGQSRSSTCECVGGRDPVRAFLLVRACRPFEIERLKPACETPHPFGQRLLAALIALAMMFAGSAILWVVAPH